MSPVRVRSPLPEKPMESTKTASRGERSVSSPGQCFPFASLRARTNGEGEAGGGLKCPNLGHFVAVSRLHPKRTFCPFWSGAKSDTVSH
jgi:hypothetical protein